MKITVYGGSHWDRSGKIRWLLEELGITHDDHWLDVEKGDRDSGPYLQVNPLGRIPAVTLDGKPMIEGTCQFLNGIGITSWNDMVGAKASSFCLFASTRSKGSDFASKGGGKFQRHMPETADADDPDSTGRLSMHRQRTEHRDASTQQWTHFGGWKSFRNRYRPRPVRAHVTGKSPLVPHHDEGRLRT